MKSITRSLLKIENDARAYFEKFPFIQALLAGFGVIVFWRGIWEWFDQMQVSPLVSIVIGAVVLAGVGVFLQTFIGNTIIIKEVKQEEQKEEKEIKKFEQEIEKEIEQESK